MCGIAGMVLSRGTVDEGALRRAGACLRHRGPDDEGVYLSPSGAAGLAFRRLSIIDLSQAGHQPMPNADGTRWIIFNGEVYNFRELRAELEACGRTFRSRTDSEVVLQAYEEWGERCLDRFIGMFAFAIWNEPERSLFLARDRLGIKPLYYAVDPAGIRFGSELKALLELGVSDRSLDAVALREYLGRGYVSAPRSILAAVRSLPPGHLLVWRAGALEIRRYWDPLEYARPQPAKEDEALDQLEDLLRSSVKYRLVSDVPVGAFLSGGLDSSLVAAVMRAVDPGEVRTFTVGFADRSHDESARAEAIARHLGTTHLSLVASESDALALVPRLPELFDEPFADSSQIPTYLVSRLTRDHVTVALSGDGGDELFAGYDTYGRFAEVSRYWRLPSPVRSVASGIGRRLGGGRARLLSGLHLAEPLAYAETAWRIWTPRDLAELAPGLASVTDDQQHAFTANRYRGLAPVERMMLSDLERYLPNDILTKVDRASMAASLEARVPLLDHRLVQFALSLPPDLKRRNGTSKVLLRRLLGRYLPPELIGGPKQGFSVPLGSWLTGALRPLVATHLSADRIGAYGLLAPSVVQRTVAAAGESRVAAERLWSLLMLQLWLERNISPERVEIV